MTEKKTEVKKEKKKDEPLVIASNPVKFKDRPTRDTYALDLTKLSFVPDIIVIAKVKGRNNTMRVLAIKNSHKKDGNTTAKPDTKKTDKK